MHTEAKQGYLIWDTLLGAPVKVITGSRKACGARNALNAKAHWETIGGIPQDINRRRFCLTKPGTVVNHNKVA